MPLIYSAWPHSSGPIIRRVRQSFVHFRSMAILFICCQCFFCFFFVALTHLGKTFFISFFSYHPILSFPWISKQRLNTKKYPQRPRSCFSLSFFFFRPCACVCAVALLLPRPKIPPLFIQLEQSVEHNNSRDSKFKCDFCCRLNEYSQWFYCLSSDLNYTILILQMHQNCV